MTFSNATPLETLELTVEGTPSAAATTLAALPAGAKATIARVALAGEELAWLCAVGIGAGDVLTVLRRAAFGGPIHVRTESGAEFAVARSLARDIGVRIVTAPPEP